VTNPLATRLWEILRAAHEPWDVDVSPGWGEDFECYPAGDAGVVAFCRGYLLVGWPPDADISKCIREALPVIAAKLQEGPLLLMVYYRNFRCVKAVRRLGATLLGVDDSQFFHYRLTAEDYRYGQKVSAS
jgi:hypothetical protein